MKSGAFTLLYHQTDSEDVPPKTRLLDNVSWSVLLVIHILAKFGMNLRFAWTYSQSTWPERFNRESNLKILKVTHALTRWEASNQRYAAIYICHVATTVSSLLELISRDYWKSASHDAGLVG